jgi:hypothetical protein
MDIISKNRIKDYRNKIIVAKIFSLTFIVQTASMPSGIISPKIAYATLLLVVAYYKYHVTILNLYSFILTNFLK